MSLDQQQCAWHHTCQQEDIVQAIPPCLELVPSAANSELCTAKTVRHPQEEVLRFCRMYDNIPSIYFNLNATGTILFVNQFGADCLGYLREELIQKPIFNLFALSERQRLSDILLGLLRETPITGEFRLDCPASQISWVKVVARILPGEEQPVIMIICEDITKYKHAETDYKAVEAAFQQSQKVMTAQLEKIESLNSLQEDFLGTVSYELRTPLTNMKMAIQMLLVAMNQAQNFGGEIVKPHIEQSKAARYFLILSNECDRQINQINNFLDLYRLETNPKPVVLEKIHVQEWVVQVVQLFNTGHRNFSVHQVHTDVAANLPALVCDPFSLKRILIELLTNACKFSPPGENITVTAQLQCDCIKLQVINSGVEIPASELPRIFDKFYRIPSNDPRKQGGTGLGLALVQKLIKHLGGTIKAESKLDCTYFTILLPLGRGGVRNWE
ncbi:MAG: PAS domain-containing sensor histidine kinase [Rhizonema sp. NSF051]|nr:PAS domain-containing sensor histidine kinase [Rhizonema sp. NSF051]